MKNLEIIDSVKVPISALDHHYYEEAKALGKIMRNGKGTEHGGVVGTENSQRAELYAWHNPVRTHIDSKDGDCWIYGLMLKTGTNLEIGCIDPGTGRQTVIHPSRGQIYRLHDRLPHWTLGSGHSVAIFTGCYHHPYDDRAVQVLNRGLQRLANGVRTAPRASPGYRVLFSDEVYASNDFEKLHLVSRKLAEKRGWTIEECGICNKAAFKIDSHWPYHTELNRCYSCRELHKGQ